MSAPGLTWINDGRHEEEIARFVFEADEVVTGIVVGARDDLRKLTEGKYLGFAATLAAATEDGDPEPLKAAVHAVYLHLRHDYQLTYEYEQGFNPATGEQRIRLPADVSRHDGGTCIDLTLLFLSCLAFPKLRPFYIHLRGHAMAGVWLREPPPEAEKFLLLRDLDELRRKVRDGQILVLESMGFSRGSHEYREGLTFADAQARARQRLDDISPDQFEFALDVMAAWDAGYYPADALRTRPPTPDACSLGKGVVPEQLRACFDYPFNSFMVSRTRNFVGREFVFRELDDFLARERSGYFIIRGQPGIGKSALMSQLVKTRDYPHHFNITLQGIDTPRQLLTHACAQLIVRYELPYQSLPEDAGENGRFLGKLLEEAGRKLQGGRKLVLAVDALDEVQRGTGAANVLFLPPHLPDGVYVVVTGREQQDLTLRVESAHHFDLRPDSDANLRDVRAYVERRLPDPGIQTWMAARGLGPDEFVGRMVQNSEGNFMYLHHVLPAIAAGKFDFRLEDLPRGLTEYYQHPWKQMRREDPERFDQLYHPVVCLLAAAREAVSAEQVAEWTGLAAPRVRRVLGEWREFLDEQRGKERERLYRVYHGTFRQWLQDEVDPGLRSYHAMIDDAIERKVLGHEGSSP